MPRLSVASVYLSGGSEVHPIPLFFPRKRASALRLRTDFAEEKTAYRAGKGDSLKKYPRQEMAQNSRETNLSAILGRSHPGRTPSSSLLQYRERRNHKSEELFQVIKNPAGEKIAEEPAESLARHQNCQFRENIRGTTFKGSQLLKLLQAHKKKRSPQSSTLYGLFISFGAEGETRTPMPLPALDPEPSVSTNSTTSALL